MKTNIPQSIDLLKVFEILIFLVLVSLAYFHKRWQKNFYKKSVGNWGLDLINLFFQGNIIPLLQTFFLFRLLQFLFPNYQGFLDLPPYACFLLNFLLVDYIYYWGHRLLHSNFLWNTHKVHHSVEHMDVFSSSRNTLWTSLLIVYVWINSLFIFLLADPSYFIYSISLTAMLDLWRHSNLYPKQSNIFTDLFETLFISPKLHSWHHSDQFFKFNFGANLSLWDRIHKTYKDDPYFPAKLGISTNLVFWKKLFYPFGEKA